MSTRSRSRTPAPGTSKSKRNSTGRKAVRTPISTGRKAAQKKKQESPVDNLIEGLDDAIQNILSPTHSTKSRRKSSSPKGSERSRKSGGSGSRRNSPGSGKRRNSLDERDVERLITSTLSGPTIRLTQGTIRDPAFAVIIFAGSFILYHLPRLAWGWASIVVGFLYPAWASFKVLEYSRGDLILVRFWLTYWVCYASFTVAEIFVDLILFWVPLYYLFKIVFLVWLFLPQTKGALLTYRYIIAPFLLRHEDNIEGTLIKARTAAGEVGARAFQIGSQMYTEGSRRRRSGE